MSDDNEEAHDELEDLIPPHVPVKAYENPRFLGSPDARPLRILSEYLEPASRLRRAGIRDMVVFFGSARIPKPAQAQRNLAALQSLGNTSEREIQLAERMLRLSRYYDEALELSRLITEWSKGLTGERHFIVCSGGGGGIMEAVNEGASRARGKSVGFNISLPFEQGSNRFITRHLVFDFHYFFMRKFWFVYLAKAIIVFPGGFGTMDELMEVLTLIQTKKPRKTLPVVLYGSEYWNSVVNFRALADWGTICDGDLDLFYFADDPQQAFEHIRRRLEELYLQGPGGLDVMRIA